MKKRTKWRKPESRPLPAITPHDEDLLLLVGDPRDWTQAETLLSGDIVVFRQFRKASAQKRRHGLVCILGRVESFFDQTLPGKSAIPSVRIYVIAVTGHPAPQTGFVFAYSLPRLLQGGVLRETRGKAA